MRYVRYMETKFQKLPPAARFLPFFAPFGVF
jgi:hypothetical protein